MASCTTCEVWMQEKEKLLNNCNSVFEAVSKLYFFEEQCQKNCMFNEELQSAQVLTTSK